MFKVRMNSCIIIALDTRLSAYDTYVAYSHFVAANAVCCSGRAGMQHEDCTEKQHAASLLVAGSCLFS